MPSSKHTNGTEDLALQDEAALSKMCLLSVPGASLAVVTVASANEVVARGSSNLFRLGTLGATQFCYHVEGRLCLQRENLRLAPFLDLRVRRQYQEKE